MGKNPCSYFLQSLVSIKWAAAHSPALRTAVFNLKQEIVSKGNKHGKENKGVLDKS